MQIKAGKIVLKCEAVPVTRGYLKYRLPGEVFEDEEPDVLFSGRHIHVRKGDDNKAVKEIVVELEEVK